MQSTVPWAYAVVNKRLLYTFVFVWSAASSPAYCQTITMNGQVLTTSSQQGELGDELLGELQEQAADMQPSVNLELPTCLDASTKTLTTRNNEKTPKHAFMPSFSSNRYPLSPHARLSPPTWCGPYTLLPRVMMMGSLYDVM